MSTTNDPNDPRLKNIEASGMQESYLVLSDAERAEGYVRPVRRTYLHVGAPVPANLRDLTEEEHERYDRYGYVKFEEYPDDDGTVTGKFWTENQLNSGCGAATTMGQAIAETYARNPSFYVGTFCASCGDHFPVGAFGEFVWDGTEERVGT